jgi:hypothetical protein
MSRRVVAWTTSGPTSRAAGGALRRAEIHRYEAHGIGRVRLEIKRFLDVNT